MPRAGLDSETVVSAAAALADDEGLEAVTLARVAAQLGVRSPSLYVHVDGLPDLRRRIAALAAREHPGAYAATQHTANLEGPEAGVAAGDLLDVVLAVLRGYALEDDAAIHAARVVRSALHGFVSLESEAGFGIPLDLDQSFSLLVAVLDRGLR